MQSTRNDTAAVGLTSVEILPLNLKRTGFYLTVTGANPVTFVKGPVAAVEASGIKTQPTATFFETDGDGFRCWKGPIQAISTGVSSVGISESTEQ